MQILEKHQVIDNLQGLDKMGCKTIKIKKDDLDDTTKSMLDTIQLNSSNPTLIGQHLEILNYFQKLKELREKMGR